MVAAMPVSRVRVAARGFEIWTAKEVEGLRVGGFLSLSQAIVIREPRSKTSLLWKIPLISIVIGDDAERRVTVPVLLKA